MTSMHNSSYIRSEISEMKVVKKRYLKKVLNGFSKNGEHPVNIFETVGSMENSINLIVFHARYHWNHLPISCFFRYSTDSLVYKIECSTLIQYMIMCPLSGAGFAVLHSSVHTERPHMGLDR